MTAGETRSRRGIAVHKVHGRKGRSGKRAHQVHADATSAKLTLLELAGHGRSLSRYESPRSDTSKRVTGQTTYTGKGKERRKERGIRISSEVEERDSNGPDLQMVVTDSKGALQHLGG